MKSEEAVKAKIKQAINSTYNAISYKEEKTNFVSPRKINRLILKIII